jgi:hypothetical protein
LVEVLIVLALSPVVCRSRPPLDASWVLMARVVHQFPHGMGGQPIIGEWDEQPHESLGRPLLGVEPSGVGAIAPVPKILRDFWPFLCSNPAEFDSQKTLWCKSV